MQALPIGLAVAGSLIQGIGGYKAGKENRRIAEINAVNAEREGAAETSRIRAAARLHLGRQIGAQAESGFEVGTGSALDSLLESATNAELEIMDAQRQSRSRAMAYRAGGATAEREGRMGLIGSLFGAAGTVAKHRADYAQAGSG